MVKTLAIIAYLWRRRYALIIPAVLGALCATLYSLITPSFYEATTTLRMDASRIQSPVLRNISLPEHLEILDRTLKSDSVVLDTLKETGLALAEGKQTTLLAEKMRNSLEFNVINDDLLRINYRSEDPQNVKYVLEILSLNFIGELLAPERFRMDNQLASLESQIKRYYSRQKLTEQSLEKAKNVDVDAQDEKNMKTKLAEIVALEFDLQRMEAQRLFAQEEYDRLLSTSKRIFNTRDKTSPGSLFWFAEAPRMVGAPHGSEQHLRMATLGLIVGFFVGLLLLVLGRVFDSSFRNDQEAAEYLGVKVLGHIPNLGNITFEKGQISVSL